MSDINLTASAAPPRRPPGRPFQKGPDPRRSKFGPVSKDRVAWAKKFNNMLAKKLPPEEAVDILIKEYKRGKSWAIIEVLKRLVGEPIHTLEISSVPEQKLVIEVVKTEEKQ